MRRSEYDFWVLDLDGTVVDVEASYIQEVCTEVGNRLDVSFTGTEAEHLWYGYDEGRNGVLARAGVDPDRFWDVFHEVDQPHRRAAATHIYPDAERFVASVDAPIGVVTHCQEYLTGPILDSLDIADWFDTVVCCSDETGWKPDPRPVEMAMDHLGVGDNGHTGALVGDHPDDVNAARNAGLAGIQVDRAGVATGGSTSGPDTVRELTELVN